MLQEETKTYKFASYANVNPPVFKSHGFCSTSCLRLLCFCRFCRESLFSCGIPPVDTFSCLIHLNQLQILYLTSSFEKKDICPVLSNLLLLSLHPFGFPSVLFLYHYFSSVLKGYRCKHLCCFCYVYPEDTYKMF